MWPFKPKYLELTIGRIEIEQIKDYSAHIFSVNDLSSRKRQYVWVVIHFYNGEYLELSLYEITPVNREATDKVNLMLRHSIAPAKEIPIWEMLEQKSIYPPEPRWHGIADSLRKKELTQSQLEWIITPKGGQFSDKGK